MPNRVSKRNWETFQRTVVGIDQIKFTFYIIYAFVLNVVVP